MIFSEYTKRKIEKVLKDNDELRERLLNGEISAISELGMLSGK